MDDAAITFWVLTSWPVLLSPLILNADATVDILNLTLYVLRFSFVVGRKWRHQRRCLHLFKYVLFCSTLLGYAHGTVLSSKQSFVSSPEVIELSGAAGMSLVFCWGKSLFTIEETDVMVFDMVDVMVES